MARKPRAARSAFISPPCRSVSSGSSASPRRKRGPASASSSKPSSSARRPWAALPSGSIASPRTWWGGSPFAKSSRFPRRRRARARSRTRPRPWMRASSATWASASSKDPGRRDRSRPRHPPHHRPARPQSPGPARPPRRASEAPRVAVRREGDLAGPRRHLAGRRDAAPAGGEGGAGPDRDAPRAADIRSALRIAGAEPDTNLKGFLADAIAVPSRRKLISPKTVNQKRYLDAVRSHDLVIAIGPAGTGKSYLAVAMAVAALVKREVS